MSSAILVGYATRYGSTQAVAEAIAGKLRRHGLAVDVRPLPEVDSLDGYGALVLGTPIYVGRWHGNARTFLARHRDDLTERPVAVFELGMTIVDDGPEPVHERMDAQLAAYPWLAPVSTASFAGSYDPARLTGLHKLLPILPGSPIRGKPALDARDWDAIGNWANELAPKLAEIAA